MKMPEKHDLLAAILAAKKTRHGAIRALPAYLRNGLWCVAAVIERDDVRHYRLIHSMTFSTSPD